MKMEQTECSETLAYKIQMPGNYPEESIQSLLLIATTGSFLLAWVTDIFMLASILTHTWKNSKKKD